jgi:hypothetical protein
MIPNFPMVSRYRRNHEPECRAVSSQSAEIYKKLHGPYAANRMTYYVRIFDIFHAGPNRQIDLKFRYDIFL